MLESAVAHASIQCHPAQAIGCNNHIKARLIHDAASAPVMPGCHILTVCTLHIVRAIEFSRVGCFEIVHRRAQGFNGSLHFRNSHLITLQHFACCLQSLTEFLLTVRLVLIVVQDVGIIQQRLQFCLDLSVPILCCLAIIQLGIVQYEQVDGVLQHSPILIGRNRHGLGRRKSIPQQPHSHCIVISS